MKRFFSLFSALGILPLLAGCGRLATIPMSPQTTPDQWLATHPHLNIEIFSRALVLAKPSSSAIVYFLALVTLAAGFVFLRGREDQKSKTWWGIALLLWGIGTVLAGTSYQAFAWEIKCAGQETCSWTSWFEVLYMIFEVASVNAMVYAVAWSTLNERHRAWVRVYVLANTGIYLVVALAGALIPSWFLVSFELMLLFCIPGLIAAFIFNVRGYREHHDIMNRNLVIAWIILFLVMVAYYGYLMAGYGEKLWEKGIWFSANDVLHIGLVIWMLYLAGIVSGKVRDRT
jgi:hypothetical protein